MQLRGIAIDPERARSPQLVLAVAAGQQADAEHPRPTRRQQVPDRVADDVAVARSATPSRSWQARKRSGSGLARSTSPRSTTTVSAGTPSASSDASISGRRPDVAMPWTTPLRRRSASSSTAPGSGRRSGRISRKISPCRRWSASVSLVRQAPPDLAGDGAGEEPAAHADPAMDPPAVDRVAGLEQRPLPGEDVGVDGVDERAVEVEDQCLHGQRIARRGAVDGHRAVTDDPAVTADDDLDAREAERIRRRDREAAAEARDLMKPGMGKVFKQIQDAQRKAAEEVPEKPAQPLRRRRRRGP